MESLDKELIEAGKRAAKHAVCSNYIRSQFYVNQFNEIELAVAMIDENNYLWFRRVWLGADAECNRYSILSHFEEELDDFNAFEEIGRRISSEVFHKKFSTESSHLIPFDHVIKAMRFIEKFKIEVNKLLPESEALLS